MNTNFALFNLKSIKSNATLVDPPCNLKETAYIKHVSKEVIYYKVIYAKYNKWFKEVFR